MWYVQTRMTAQVSHNANHLFGQRLEVESCIVIGEPIVILADEVAKAETIFSVDSKLKIIHLYYARLSLTKGLHPAWMPPPGHLWSDLWSHWQNYLWPGCTAAGFWLCVVRTGSFLVFIENKSRMIQKEVATAGKEAKRLDLQQADYVQELAKAASEMSQPAGLARALGREHYAFLYISS